MNGEKALQQEYARQKVFYFHATKGWEQGLVMSVRSQETRGGFTCVVFNIQSAVDNTESEFVFKSSLIHKCVGGIETMAPDNLLSLPEIHNAILVNALYLRHKKDVMYTHLGELVVAVNPFKYSIPWYQDSCAARYLEHLHQPELPPELPPHTWSVAHRAYVTMRTLHLNHSIVISGESGSGKTESCKSMIRYLCQVSEHLHKGVPRMSKAIRTINDRVQLSNVIMESFGNAKTLRNDNSSRFGKFTEVQFDSQGVLVGMRTTPFLLERSRIVHCALDERVFHCFYQLAASPNEKLRAALGMRTARDFALLNQGKCVSLKSSGVDDAADFVKVVDAFRALQFSDEEQQTVWKIVAAVAHLQNVEYVERPNAFGRKALDEAEIEKSSVELVTFVAKEILSLSDPQLLFDSLVSNRSTVKGESVVRKLTTQKAKDQRDNMCKHLYSKLFTWIVDKINAATAFGADGIFVADDPQLRPHQQPTDAPERLTIEAPSSWIALLDIFGFEDFPQNSFEQFCINLANETLQRHYTKHHFIRDMEEMKNEGISTQQVKFVDNQPCVDLLAGTTKSVISCLDDCSALDMERGAANNPNLTFLANVTNLHRPNFQTAGAKGGGRSVLDRQGPTATESIPLDNPSDFYYRGRLDDDSFTIRHYAGDVKYKVDGFVEKNMDGVHESTLVTLSTTTNFVLKSILDVEDAIGLLADMKAAGSPGSPRKAGGAFGSPRSAARGGAAAGGGGAAGAKKTVASQFRNSLKTLMDTLDQSHPHWVRCIRPHVRKSPNLFDGKLVLEQLVATGVLSTIEQRQRNFPFRMSHVEFITRYSVLSASTLRRLGPRSTTTERCAVVLGAVPELKKEGGTATAGGESVESLAQVGRGKVFLSSKVQKRLEELRRQVLDDHVLRVSAFIYSFQSRRVKYEVLWTKYAIVCQRRYRLVLRLHRCAKNYYAELCQRILDRHTQEQRDLAHYEVKNRSRAISDEQQFRGDVIRDFRTLLVPMIATVLKNIRSVESLLRDELSEEVKKSFWSLEAYFVQGVADAHERRRIRLVRESEIRIAAQQKLIAMATEAKAAVMVMERQERHHLETVEIAPRVKEIKAKAALILEHQRERDRELRTLCAQRNAELMRQEYEEERQRKCEADLWRNMIGEENYQRDLCRWRHLPPEAFRSYMREFYRNKCPSQSTVGLQTVTSYRDVASVWEREYRADRATRTAGVDPVDKQLASAASIAPLAMVAMPRTSGVAQATMSPLGASAHRRLPQGPIVPRKASRQEIVSDSDDEGALLRELATPETTLPAERSSSSGDESPQRSMRGGGYHAAERFGHKYRVELQRRSKETLTSASLRCNGEAREHDSKQRQDGKGSLASPSVNAGGLSSKYF